MSEIKLPITDTVFARAEDRGTRGADEYVVLSDKANPDQAAAVNSEGALRVGLPQSVDAGNTTARTVADAGTQFVGAWSQTRSLGIVRQLVVLASTVSSGLGGTFVFEYSEDGVTATISESRTITDFATVRDFDLINAGEYFRVKFTPDRPLAGAEMVFITTTMRRQNDGAFVRLANQEIEEANAAMGQQFAYIKAFDPDTGKSVNIRPTAQGDLRVGFSSFDIDAFDCTALVIANGGNFTSAWVNVSDFAGLRVATMATNVITGYVDWSLDGVTTNHSYSTPFAGAGDFHLPIGATYARLRITNNSGGPVTFDLRVSGFYSAPSPFLFPVAGGIQGNFPALLVKSSSTGTQPDGDYVNEKADGTAFSTDTPLGAGGIYLSPWFDTDGWRSVELCISTNQVSASLGVEIEFTDDVEAGTPTVRQPTRKTTFTAADMANGGFVYRFATRLDGLRVRYTNGGVAQGSFHLEVNLRVEATQVGISNIESELNSTVQATMSRSVAFGKDPSLSTYDNITRTTTDASNRTGSHVGIVKHEVRTPLKPCDSWKVTKTTITTTATDIIAAASALASRVTLEVYNADSTKDIHVGISTAAVAGGSFRTIAPGQGITLELGPGATLSGKASTGSCSVEVVEIADTTSSG